MNIEESLVKTLNRSGGVASGEHYRVSDWILKHFIVIERTTLPQVTPEQPGYSGYVEIGGRTIGLHDVDYYDREIATLLALRGYVTGQPSVNATYTSRELYAMTRDALLRIACEDLGLELDEAHSHRDGLVSAILREQIGLALCAGEATPHI